MLSMKRRNMKGKHVTDSGSENVDAEKANGPNKEVPEVLPSPNVKPVPENPLAESIVSLTGYSGPPWSNPEILKDLNPEKRYDLLKSALEAGTKKEENQFQITKQKLDADTENNKRSQRFSLVVIVVALLFCFALSWLFLTFDAKDLVTPVIAALVAFAGGYGLGRRASKDS